MGLLDIFDSEQGRLGLAMLAAAGPQARPMGFGERMMGALGTVDEMRQRKEAKTIAEQERALRRQLIDSQIAETNAQAEERKAKALRDATALKREQDFLGALAPRREPAAPGQIGSGSFGVVDTGGLPDMPAEMPRNWSALASQFPDKIDTLEKIARANTFGAPKVARTIKGMGPDGKEYEYQVDEFGKPVGQGFAQFRAPIQVNQGDRTTFADPYTLQPRGSMPMNMSPADRDASARGWASNALARQRLELDKVGKPEFRDGQWVMPPKDMKPGDSRSAMPAVAVKDANDALSLISQARKIIPNATGSYLGAGIDQVGRVFGKSLDGDQAAAQLKALEGALVAKMPKMSGPQSDKDVLLYRQMAGEIGDPTIPAPRKMAALKIIEDIQNRYATGQGGMPAPQAPRNGMMGSGAWGIERIN